jgi:hypothetical protein
MASDLQKFGLRLEKHTVRTHTHDLQIGHPDTQQLHSCQPANLVARRPPRPPAGRGGRAAYAGSWQAWRGRAMLDS